jgi:hypothetical protein
MICPLIGRHARDPSQLSKNAPIPHDLAHFGGITCTVPLTTLYCPPSGATDCSSSIARPNAELPAQRAASRSNGRSVMNRNRCLSLFVVLSLYAWTSSAFATVFSYEAIMTGPGESPANASPGTGFGTVDYDNILHTLSVNCSFTGLTGTTTASHIHAATLVPFAGTAGVATTTPTFAGFPLGVTSGSYSNILDLTLASSYNPAFVSANGGTTASAEAALTSAIATGQAYWNIHSTTFGGGEIRGFLIPNVPEPTSCVLITLGMAGLGCASRRRRA